MPHPPPVDYLQEDEAVLLQERRHPLSVLDDLLAWLFPFALVAGGTVFFLEGFRPDLWQAVGVPVLATLGFLYALVLVSKWWRVQTSRYVVTGDRVYKSHGRLRYFLGQTTYDKLTDIHVKQSLFGRWGGFGTIRLETAGTGLALEGVLDPFGTKRTIERARTDFVGGLVADHRARHAAGARHAHRGAAEAVAADDTGTDSGDETPLWRGGPSGAFLSGRLLFSGVLALVAFSTLAGGLVDSRLLLLGGAFLLYAALSAARAAIDYRFTRYHVTPGGVVVTSGWLTRRRVETTYEKVTDVTTYQGIWGRILDFGHITINTAGGSTAPVLFRGMKDPEAVKRVIDDARRRWRNGG